MANTVNSLVEIKFLLLDEVAERAESEFNLDDFPELLRVAFFDTTELNLFNGGILEDADIKVILRVRLKQDKDKGSTTLKLRSAGTLPKEWQTDEGLDRKREFDFAFDRQLMDSFSIDADVQKPEIIEVLETASEIKKLFTKEQRNFFQPTEASGFHWHTLRIF